MEFKKEVLDFLKKDSNWLKKLIVIYGPTASWKTGLSIEVAKIINTEIISTDSRQIYIWLDIWTWKITDKEKQWVKHYMIDILEPNEEYSVWIYKKEAEKYLDDIYAKWKIPILCWWTGLYIDSLIFDFDIPKLPADKDLRDKLEQERLEKWNEYIRKKLYEIDPEYAKELHPNNYRYVIRAIEVKTLTWKSKKDFRKEKKLKYDVLFLTPYDWDREKLYKRIDERIERMFEDWLVNEVENLLKKYNENDFWMRSIGYKEVIDFLNWKINYEECVELVQKNNRNYAKRQLTWFNRYEIYK